MTEADSLTAWLKAARAGDRVAADRLYSEIYELLRGIARRQLRGDQQRVTLEALQLVELSRDDELLAVDAVLSEL